MPDNSLIRANQQPEHQHQSPFDAIRGYRADGSEYWTARELMRWLGYKNWQNAEKAIKRAIKSLENQGHNSSHHLTEVSKVVHRQGSGSLEIKDFELSRLGCYTVAMNADPEKEMVAQAQAYFATKTRQAELLQEKPKLPQTFAEALRAYADELEAKERLEKENKILLGENNLLSEDNDRLAEAVDELFDYSSIIRVAKYNQVSERCFSWHRLKAVSVQTGSEIKKVPDPRFGSKNLYSHDVWRLAYPDVSLPETTVIRLVP